MSMRDRITAGRHPRHGLRGFLPWAAVVGLALAGQAATPPSSFLADCEVLTQAPHRLTGTPECEAAARHVETRLRALSPDRLIVQSFPSARLVVGRCDLTIEGRAEPLRLHPMRPNTTIPPATTPEGIRGRLVYVGDGAAGILDKTEVCGAIAVLDYNSDDGWMRAFRLGAVAVIFVANGRAEAWHPHNVDACANLPRYYYPGPVADLALPAAGTVTCEVTWDRAVGRNLIAYFAGTAPTFHQEKEEVLILAANLDSYGEVPTLSPGARGAANCAALLQLAEQVSRKRPRRHLLFVFFDGEARGHAGSSVFYRSLEADNKKVTVETRQESLTAETGFLAKLTALAAEEQPLTATTATRRQLMNRLKDRAAEHAYGIMDDMQVMREERQRLRLAGGNEERIAKITGELDGEWTTRKDEWNDLRRALGRDRTETISEGVREKLGTILDEVRRDLAIRTRELALETEALAADTALRDLLKDRWIALHASLLLGDSTERWGLVIGGDSSLHSWDDNPGLYGKVQSVFLRSFKAMDEKGCAPPGFVPESADQSLPKTRVLWGGPFLIHSGEIAGLFGIYNLCVATCQESTVLEGTPDDTLANLRTDRIAGQTAALATLLLGPAAGSAGAGGESLAVADQDGLSLRRGVVERKEYELPRFENDMVHGPMVMGMLPGSTMPNTPMAGAIVLFRPRNPSALSFERRKPYAFDDFQVLRANQNGVYAIGPVTGGWSWQWGYGGFAAVFDSRGLVTSVSDMESYRNIRYRLNMFRCRPGVFVLPPSLRNQKMAGDDVLVYSSKANGQLSRKKSFVELFDGVTCWYNDTREKGLKFFGLNQMAALNNGPEVLSAQVSGGTPLPPDGRGFPMGTEDLRLRPMTQRSASDLWRLNDSRISILRKKNIQDSSLAELHGRAEDLLLASGRSQSPYEREALALSAFWGSRPVYWKVRSMLDDLVFAVLILLGLSVPFAFALERVVIGSAIIYRQIVWFVVFFVLTFLTLYLSHPAFAIANTPIIIFLGFAIVVMASLVIGIIMSKFEVELKALQGMTTTVHAADVSRVSTFMAAMHMGISTMRRRPLRTALTAVTIILLTFTILCFASFGTQSGIVTLFSAPNPPYSGVWVHDVNWSTLAPDLLDVLQGRWGRSGRIYPRYWICPKTLDNPGILVTRADGTGPLTVRGVLGLEPDEIQQRPDLAGQLGSDFSRAVLITESLARELTVKPGDSIILGGVPLTVGPLLNAATMSMAKDMDGSSVLPVDFTEVKSQQQTQAPTQEDLLSRRTWASLPVDSVVVVSATTARNLGAGLYGVMLYTADTARASVIGEDIARVLAFPIIATRTNGAYLHLLGTVLAASGFSDLFFPILLGGLVIFGTMLGSVSDREREIYTFSALGLAPRHVATLFFAESVVYSLLGGMGGYLLAQATMKILTVLSEYGWVLVPEMNMSSTNTIVTILIVMATVLVSAIYPAIKASKSANPGLMRVWRPPEAKGDLLDLVFPFTVSEYDITGVVSFLKEHFDNYSDTGLGHFMSSDARLVREGDRGLGLDANLALAPFDLGVSQSFALRSTPSEIPGIDEVRIRMERQSGQPKDWQRLNKVFLDDIRKQFLIWRSLSHETMEQYRQRTLTELGSRPATPVPPAEPTAAPAVGS